MNVRQIALLALACMTTTGAALAANSTAGGPSIERGRYIVRTSGCNDCHTPGYPQSGGAVPEGDWLTGSNVGFQGGWGTTYPANLRLTLASMSEAQFLTRARAPMRPPMPWFNLRDMTDDDLRSLYRYVTSLGPKGTAAPAFAAPDQKVATPYIVFEPQNLSAARAAR